MKSQSHRPRPNARLLAVETMEDRFLLSGYTVTDLGVVPGLPDTAQCQARGLNNLGQVAGSCHWQGKDKALTRAFLYRDGTLTDLGNLGIDFAEATTVNDVGQVVGRSGLADKQSIHAFLWQDAGMIDLGTLGGPWSWANAINASGQVAGFADTDVSGVTHAYLRTGEQMNDLGTLGKGRFLESFAWGLNNRGQVVGWADRTGVGSHAFLYDEGQMTDLESLGSRVSIAYAINDAGQAVGAADGGGFFSHAYLWQNGKMIDLGILAGGQFSRALAINATGEVVGTGSSRGRDRAIFFGNGGPTDLNDLIPAGSGWELTKATGINDAGQIVGVGRHDEHERAFLLTPNDSAARHGGDAGVSTLLASVHETARGQITSEPPATALGERLAAEIEAPLSSRARQRRSTDAVFAHSHRPPTPAPGDAWEVEGLGSGLFLVLPR